MDASDEERTKLEMQEQQGMGWKGRDDIVDTKFWALLN
jgi:hypothetical protein